MATCRSCEAPIVFVQMATGKAMPCNPGADEHGNIACQRRGHRAYVEGHVITDARPAQPDETVLLAHWAVCEKSGHTDTPKPTPKPAQRQPGLF